MSKDKPELTQQAIIAGIRFKLNKSSHKATSARMLLDTIRKQYGAEVTNRALNQAIDRMIKSGQLRRLDDGRYQLIK